MPGIKLVAELEYKMFGRMIARQNALPLAEVEEGLGSQASDSTSVDILGLGKKMMNTLGSAFSKCELESEELFLVAMESWNRWNGSRVEAF